MPPEYSSEEVMTAVQTLRDDVERRSISPANMEKITAVLDSQEEKSRELVIANEKVAAHETEIAELKESWEAAGATATEVSERLEKMEAKMARRGADPSTVDPHAYKEEQEYKSLQAWSRGGHNWEAVLPEHKALLRTDSSPDGGYLVPVEMDTSITKKIVELDGIRPISRVRTISSKAIDIPIRNTIPVATYEGEAGIASESVATYESVQVTPFRQTHVSPITADQLMDAAFDMDSEISDDAALAFAFGEGNGFVVGDGFKKPGGFTAHSTLQTGARNSGSAADITADSLILLTGDLKVGYNPTYVMNRRTLARIRTFIATTNQYLWQPGLNGPVSNTINGFNYVIANSMPDLGANAFAVAFGDFRAGYTIVDRTGMTVIRDDITKAPDGIIKFTFRRWNTGMVTLPEAIKLLKCST